MVQRKQTHPSYLLHKPSGQARIRIDGRDIYLGKYDSPESRAAYDRLVNEWKQSGRVIGPNDVPIGATIDELILAYHNFASTYYVKNGEPTSTQQHIRDAVKPLHRLYGGQPADSFGPLRLKALRQQMIDDDRWCRTQINKSIGIIKRMFKWGVESELIAAETYQKLATVTGLRWGRSEARETDTVKPVPDTIVDAVLPHVPPQVAAMINLQRLTGMRPGEVVIMRVCDLDMSGKVWTYTPTSHKTEHHGKERKIFIGPKAQAVGGP